MLTPLTEHDLLLFWLQFVLLLGMARVLGGLARRLGQPSVVGELAAGLVLGPTLLGRVAPGLAASIFPGEGPASQLILAVAWVGIVLLLVVTGFETDLQLIRRLGKVSASISLGSLLVPLAAGGLMGWLLPESLLGDPDRRIGFAMFMAVAMSISALPVVAKVLADMRLLRRDIGQIILAAGLANDLVGWILLGVVAGAAAGGAIDLTGLAITVAAVAVFVALALTVGQRLVDLVLRRTRKGRDGSGGALGATVLMALVGGVATQAMGVEAVLGAFLVGVVIGRSRYQRDDAVQALDNISHAVFAPVFFATAGLQVDLGVLAQPVNLMAALLIIAVAAATKLVGSWLGALVAGLSAMRGLAIGIGLNARGALEIVVATIGLSLGLLNQASYSAVAIMAIVTSLAAPPLLRPVLARLSPDPEEEARLRRERLLDRSVLAQVASALLPTRGGSNSVEAARVLDLALRPEAAVTVLTVNDGNASAEALDQAAGLVTLALDGREVERRRHKADDVGQALLEETELGYGLVALGLNEDHSGTDQLSPLIQQFLASCPIPVLLVRRGPATAHDFGRILVPVVGTRVGRAAEELAYSIAAHSGAEVDGVHVITQRPRGRGRADGGRAAEDQLARARDLSEGLGRTAATMVRTAPKAHEELLRAANERGADLIVLGAELRSEGAPHLGHGTEFVLEHARQTVAVVAFPTTPEGEDSDEAN